MIQPPNSPFDTAPLRWSWINPRDDSQGKFYPSDTIEYLELQAFFKHVCKRYMKSNPSGFSQGALDPKLLVALKVLQDFLLSATYEGPLSEHGFSADARRDHLTAAVFLMAAQNSTLSIPAHEIIYDSFDFSDLKPFHLHIATLGTSEFIHSQGLVEYFRSKLNISNPFSSKELSPASVSMYDLDRAMCSMTPDERDRLIDGYFTEVLAPIIEQLIGKQVVSDIPNTVQSSLAYRNPNSKIDTFQVPFKPTTVVNRFTFN